MPAMWNRGRCPRILCLLGLAVWLAAPPLLPAHTGLPLPSAIERPALQPFAPAAADNDFADADFAQADQPEYGELRGGAVTLMTTLVVLGYAYLALLGLFVLLCLWALLILLENPNWPFH